MTVSAFSSTFPNTWWRYSGPDGGGVAVLLSPLMVASASALAQSTGCRVVVTRRTFCCSLAMASPA